MLVVVMFLMSFQMSLVLIIFLKHFYQRFFFFFVFLDLPFPTIHYYLPHIAWCLLTLSNGFLVLFPDVPHCFLWCCLKSSQSF